MTNSIFSRHDYCKKRFIYTARFRGRKCPLNSIPSNSFPISPNSTSVSSFHGAILPICGTCCGGGSGSCTGTGVSGNDRTIASKSKFDHGDKVPFTIATINSLSQKAKGGEGDTRTSIFLFYNTHRSHQMPNNTFRDCSSHIRRRQFSQTKKTKIQ